MDAAKSFFKFCSENFQETYWIAGNHEYYHSDLAGRTSEFIGEIIDKVFLVNNYTVDREDGKIIFSIVVDKDISLKVSLYWQWAE